jgi:hypothetical protein
LPRARDGSTLERRSGMFGRRSPAPVGPPPSKPPPDRQRPRRRSDSVALILLGAAAAGMVGGWAVDRWSRPACDQQMDPQCPQRGAGASGSSGGGSAYRSSRSGAGSWWSGDSGASAAPAVVPRDSGTVATRRGGFGSIGRFFSGGS